MNKDTEYTNLKQRLIEKGYSDVNSLPVMARSAKDPGEAYFVALKSELKRLFELLGDDPVIDRELAAGLFGLSHIAYTHYEAAMHHGKVFRETLFDPDMIDIEMAVESIFAGEWMALDA